MAGRGGFRGAVLGQEVRLALAVIAGMVVSARGAAAVASTAAVARRQVGLWLAGWSR